MTWLDFSETGLVSFALTCLLIELTPGPNMGYLAVLSATKGSRIGYVATAGVALGLLVVGITAALGLAAIISASAVYYQMLRWAGIAYFLWLAWDGWVEPEQTAADIAKVPLSRTRYFGRGLITNLLNPKAAVFYIAVIPSFLDISRPVLAQTLLYSIVYVVIATAIHATIVFFASKAERLMLTEDRRRFVRRAMSIVLVGIALWFAWSTRR